MRYKNKMRYQILVLAYCMWMTTSESEPEPECYASKSQCYSMIIEECKLMCDLENNTIGIKCDDKDSKPSICIVEDVHVSCLDQNEPIWPNNATEEPTPCIPAECECTDKPTCTPAECGHTHVNQNNTPEPTSDSSNLTITAVLGALVGLLLLLLVAVTAILIWTCWQLKKWEGMKCNAEYQLSSTDHGQLVNPTYEGDDLLHLKPQQPVPAYETIPPHPRDGARLEFIEQGENGYHVLHREQRVNPETNTTSRHMETIPEDSREESYSKLELREESGNTNKANEEEYSKLEMMNIGSNLAKDTCLDNDATVASNDDSSEQTEGKRNVTDKKAFNDDGDVLQLESGDEEKKGQEEETKGEQPLITITPDAQNNRKDSTNPETSTTDNA